MMKLIKLELNTRGLGGWVTVEPVLAVKGIPYKQNVIVEMDEAIFCITDEADLEKGKQDLRDYYADSLRNSGADEAEVTVNLNHVRGE